MVGDNCCSFSVQLVSSSSRDRRKRFWLATKALLLTTEQLESSLVLVEDSTMGGVPRVLVCSALVGELFDDTCRFFDDEREFSSDACRDACLRTLMLSMNSLSRLLTVHLLAPLRLVPPLDLYASSRWRLSCCDTVDLFVDELTFEWCDKFDSDRLTRCQVARLALDERSTASWRKWRRDSSSEGEQSRISMRLFEGDELELSEAVEL